MTVFQRLAAIAVTAGLAMPLLSAEQTLTSIEDIQAVNTQLISGVAADAGLLARRAEVLGNLLESDPAAAVGLLLPEDVARKVRQHAPEAAPLVERRGIWDGPATVMIEDHFDSGASRTRTLITAGSEELEVLFAGDRSRVLPGQRVSVRGTRLGRRLLAAEVNVVSAAADPCTALGEQHIAVIFVETPSYKLRPTLGDPTEVRDMLTSSTTLSTQGFFADVSYGRMSSRMEFSRVYQLSRDYVPTGGDSNLILSEIMTQADKDIDFSYYNRVFIVMAYPPQSGLMGISSLGCTRRVTSPSRGTLSLSTTFMLFGTVQPAKNIAALFAHEFGHQLGLNHADTFDYSPFVVGPAGASGARTEYGDFYSNMGSPNSIQGDCWYAHWNAQQKAALNWLDPGSGYLEVDGPGTFQLAPFSSPDAATKAIRVRRAPGSDRWVWLEYRQPVGYDTDLTGCAPGVYAGMLMHYDIPAEESGQAWHTFLLDATAAETPGEFRDAALAAGKTWSDLFGPLTLRVEQAAPEGLTVAVRYDEPCVNLAPDVVRPGAEGAVGTLGVAAGPDCAWSAVSSADWLVIASGQSGTGAGSISYAIAPNRGPARRLASIGIGRREMRVEQAPYNYPPQVVSISPGSGSLQLSPGNDAANPFYTLNLTVTDPNGISDLQHVSLLINTSPQTASACYLDYNVADSALRLAADNGTTWSAARLGSPGTTLRNSQCTLDVSRSEATVSGGNLVLRVAIRFGSAFAGKRALFVSAVDAGGASLDSLAVGTYDLYVNQPPASSVTPREGSGLAQTFTIAASDPNGVTTVSVLNLTLTARGSSVSCAISVNLSSRQVMLQNDDGKSWSPATAGAPGISLQNGICGLDVSGMTFTQTKDNSAVTFPIVMMPGTAGDWAISSQAFDAGRLYFSKNEGTWTVPANTCAYMLDPPSLQVSGAGKGSVNIRTDAGCPWLASSNVSWIVLGAPIRGAGPGKFEYTVSANTSGAQRSGAVTVMKKTLAVTQPR